MDKESAATKGRDVFHEGTLRRLSIFTLGGAWQADSTVYHVPSGSFFVFRTHSQQDEPTLRDEMDVEARLEV
jgi:hypothetical protein